VVRTLVHTFHKTSFLLYFLRVQIVLVDQLRRLQRIERSGLYVLAYWRVPRKVVKASDFHSRHRVSQLTHRLESTIASISSAARTNWACIPDFAPTQPLSLTTRFVLPSDETEMATLPESKHQVKARSSRERKWACSRLCSTVLICSRLIVLVSGPLSLTNRSPAYSTNPFP
jgi:hypothetical protein